MSNENYTPPLYTLSLDMVLETNPLEWIKQRHLPIAMLEHARDNEHIRKRFHTILEDEMDVVDNMDGSGDIHASNSPAQYKQAQQTVLVQAAFQLYAPREDGITRRTIHELLKLTGGVGYTLVELLPGALRKYKPERGDFRNWFVGCVRAAMTEVRPPRVFKQQVVEEQVNDQPSPTKQASQPNQGNEKRKPWDKPTPLTESEWHRIYDSTPIGDLIGLNIVTLKPGKEGDVFVTGNKDKDVLERCFVRQLGSNQPFIRTPIEQAAYDRKHPNEDTNARESARKAGVYDMIYGKDEPTKQEDKKPDEPRPLLEHVWKENYRCATIDDNYQEAPTLKGMSVATLTPTFLDSEPPCTGDYGTDWKAYTEYRKSISKAPTLVR